MHYNDMAVNGIKKLLMTNTFCCNLSGDFASPLTLSSRVHHSKPEFFLAGEGSLRERGQSPLSKLSPFHDTQITLPGRLRGALAFLKSIGAFKRGETPLSFFPLSKQNNQGYPQVHWLERGIKGVR
jgi:hypothetical protein